MYPHNAAAAQAEQMPPLSATAPAPRRERVSSRYSRDAAAAQIEEVRISPATVPALRRSGISFQIGPISERLIAHRLRRLVWAEGIAPVRFASPQCACRILVKVIGRCKPIHRCIGKNSRTDGVKRKIPRLAQRGLGRKVLLAEIVFEIHRAMRLHNRDI